MKTPRERILAFFEHFGGGSEIENLIDIRIKGHWARRSIRRIVQPNIASDCGWMRLLRSDDGGSDQILSVEVHSSRENAITPCEREPHKEFCIMFWLDHGNIYYSPGEKVMMRGPNYDVNIQGKNGVYFLMTAFQAFIAGKPV